jgi:hypothetical protein
MQYYRPVKIASQASFEIRHSTDFEAAARRPFEPFEPAGRRALEGFFWCALQ